MRCPPDGWLEALSALCKRDGTLLVLDEIYTGFGRTGARFAYQHSGIHPDLICIGKGMAGGFPISACLGTKAAMEAWGASRGEAIHTQTFLGNPVGCAMALACMEVLESQSLPRKSAEDGAWLQERLSPLGVLRGRGLMRGLEVSNSLKLSRDLLERGYITLPAGIEAEVLAIVPPLTITRQQLESFCDCLEALL
jgi:acetylornithine/succinyldiaminopimelate/putrescine aminotransferase